MITTAIILAGGFGTRLQSVVSDLPKPMAPVNGRPFLDYQLNYLKHYGVKNVVISTGHLAGKISDHYGDSFNGLHLEQQAQISLALRHVNDASRYGRIELGNANQIVSFREKSETAEEGLINGGVYILDKNLYLRNTSGISPFSIERDFFTAQLESLVIKGFEFKGYFIDIGIPEDYNRAQHEFKGFKYK
ncbi:MAG: hypothetical protein K0S12_2278 [Bacteroidetes bacterium]|nr:hypothetical protein [Bacteroidota bacterium]